MHLRLGLGLGASCAKKLWVMMLVSWSLPHGPRKNDDLRFHQLRSIMETLYSAPDPNKVPLFCSFAKDTLQALADMDVVLPGVEAPELEAWHWLQQRAAFGRVGRRSTMCRFMSSVKANIFDLPSWVIDDSERTYACLALDFLGQRRMEPLLVKGEALQDAAEVGERRSTTDPNKPQVDEVLLRSSAKHAVAISHMLHSDRTAQSFCRIMSIPGQLVMDWHQDQNIAQRSSRGLGSSRTSPASTCSIASPSSRCSFPRTHCSRAASLAPRRTPTSSARTGRPRTTSATSWTPSSYPSLASG